MPPSGSVARPSRSRLCPLAPACGQDAGLYPPRLWWLRWWKLLPAGEQGLRAGPTRPLQSVCGCLWLPLLVTGLQWWWPQEPSASHGCAWCRSCRAAQAWGLAWPDGPVLPSPPATQRPPTPTVPALNLGGPKASLCWSRWGWVSPCSEGHQASAKTGFCGEQRPGAVPGPGIPSPAL